MSLGTCPRWASVSSCAKEEQQPLPGSGETISPLAHVCPAIGAQKMGDPRYREIKGSLTLFDTLETRIGLEMEKGTERRLRSHPGVQEAPSSGVDLLGHL